MEIKITSPSGVKLLTEKKYCLENIDVIPVLQDKSVTPGDTQQVVTPDADFAGLGSVTVEPGTVTTDATATADDIRLDKTAYGADGKMTGTIADYTGTSEPTTGKSLFAKLVDRSVTEISAEDLKGIKTIGSSAFYWCLNLKSITLPDTITYISGSAFYRAGIKNITLPESITDIGGYAFYGARLSSIVIPNKITQLLNYTFQNCTELIKVIIGNSVTSIGDFVFYQCSKLSSVKMLPTTPPTLSSSAFSNTAADLQIIVPKGTLDAYKAATNWSAYADKMVEADE